MRSLIILEVEHDETTDGLQMFAEYCARIPYGHLKWDDVTVLDYTVRVDIPECFTLASGERVTVVDNE